MRMIIAWIKKYIFQIHSPSAHANGFDFEFDYLKSLDFSSALLSSQKSIDEYSSTVKSIMNQEEKENAI